jgi:hypothetical protein
MVLIVDAGVIHNRKTQTQWCPRVLLASLLATEGERAMNVSNQAKCRHQEQASYSLRMDAFRAARRWRVMRDRYSDGRE